MVPDVKSQYQFLIKKHRICFDGPLDDQEWPASHRGTFDNIRKLNRTEFQQYQESIQADLNLHPWRQQTKRRAERIAELATLCRKGRRNEAGWRLLLESEILARFTIEVACRKCRARLWRSELEATLSEEHENAEGLKERRKKRLPCSCNPTRWHQDPQEQGVCLLFDDRAEEEIVHSQSIAADLPKKREKPDRVYGLRMTRRLERLLLWSEDKRASAGGRSISQSIKASPFLADGEPVVFPFLVIEAKSEKGADGFTDIEVQTAFTIRTLLELQQELRDAVGEEGESESSPLVWFLSYKGEQWRVSAAFIENKNGVKNYRIVDLWDGRIVSKEGALRLLLIIDYIFDWARDIYRETIISELRMLSASDTQSLARDTDVFSMLDRPDFCAPNAETSIEDDSNHLDSDVGTSVRDAFRCLDSDHGVIRDARYIRSRFMSLYLTEDNLSLFMQSMKTPEQAQNVARKILRFVKDCWRVDRETLDTIEAKWTGNDRENENIYSPKKVFFVMTTLTAYLTPSWEQTRELSLLSISAGIIESLVAYANLAMPGDWTAEQQPYVASDTLVACVMAHTCASIQDTLRAAISRACISTKLHVQSSSRKKKTDKYVDPLYAISIEEQADGAVRYRFDVAFVPDRQANAREFISSIYNIHKVGRNEPSTSFLRLSSRMEKQDPSKKSIQSLWPDAESDPIQGQTAVAVVSENPSNVSKYARICVFVLNQLASEHIEDLREHSDWITQSCLQTHRLDSKPGWGRGWNNTDVKAHEGDLTTKILQLLAHAVNRREHLARTNVQSSSNGNTKQQGKQRQTGVWNIASAIPKGLQDLWELKEHLRSCGRTVSSVTVQGRKSKDQSHTAASESQSHTVPRLQENGQRTGGKGKQRMEETSRPNVELVPIRPPAADDHCSPALRNSARELGESSSASSSLKRKPECIVIDDDDDHHDNGGESSSRAAQKRPRTDANFDLTRDFNFTRDYIDEDELQMLIAGGYFT